MDLTSQIDSLATLLQRGWPGEAAAAAAPALPGAAAAQVIHALRRLHPSAWLVAVTADLRELEQLHTDLLTLAPDEQTEPPLVLPPPATTEKQTDLELEGVRLAVARRLATGQQESDAPAPLLLTTATALLAPMAEPAALAASGDRLQVGSSAGGSFESLVSKLVGQGYQRTPEVVGKGQLAVRGGLLDIWPPDAPLPLRIDFFGDEVESIRAFDPASQRSLRQLDSLWLPPCTMEALPASPPAERLPPGAVVVWLEHDRLAANTSAPDANLPTLEAWYHLVESVAARAPLRQLFSGDPAPPHLPTIALAVAPPPGLADLADDPAHPDLRQTARQKLLAELEQRARHEGQTVIIYLDTAGGLEWLARELPADTALQLRRGQLSGGCHWAPLNLTILGQPDIYAIRKRVVRTTLHQATASRGGRVEQHQEIQPGELVVHVDHGIARFEGVKQIERDGQQLEVLSLLYADGARLHLPTSHAHLLSRYVGVGGREATLHRLGGKRWQQEKVRAERAVVDLAASLLDLQARRNARPGIPCQLDHPWMSAFEAAFPFVETPDQTRCIDDVKADLAAARPMDRLICGDAGYGKTEVAMRAAFAMVLNGRQVALLCPTTILAEQHEQTFRERMAAFPIRIDVLSRFRSQTQRSQTLTGLADGSVDIVIGTHALLQPRVKFKELGLVVIDEEQRFGVTHKERLKQVRAMVDVLTLSATPIPRTFYMSMVGARDMSLLQTPPQERLSIETRIERDNDATIQTAVRTELAREGQIYFLHNRVMTIDLMLSRLQRLLPGVRIGVAHGQQPAALLAATMRRFERGEFDLLLSTTIIESGLDIPRANTIIIHRADRFGLADLYQLRGRVGRSAKRGFAWLLLPPQGVLDDEARQRIGALQRHGGLGGGLHLALRDLEIRGAGNLLGAEQSGHITAIGFNLYCQLLRRTVARLKGEKLPLLVDVELALDFIDLSPEISDPDSAAFLPYSYIEDERQRMQIHRQMAEAVSTRELRELRAALQDRFGQPPRPVVRLLRLAELRIAAAQSNLVRIETRGERLLLIQRDGQPRLTAAGLLPRLRDTTADKKLSAIFHLLQK